MLPLALIASWGSHVTVSCLVLLFLLGLLQPLALEVGEQQYRIASSLTEVMSDSFACSHTSDLCHSLLMHSMRVNMQK